MATPEEVLARLDSDVEALRRRGYGADADRMGKVADEFRAALHPIRLVNEATAMVRSGKSARWLRQHHEGWCKVGAAGFDAKGNRLYRMCVLPSGLEIAQAVADADEAYRRSQVRRGKVGKP
jgi:hypothetical protein